MFNTKRLAASAVSAALILGACGGSNPEPIGLAEAPAATPAPTESTTTVAPATKQPVKKEPVATVPTTLAPAATTAPVPETDTKPPQPPPIVEVEDVVEEAPTSVTGTDSIHAGMDLDELTSAIADVHGPTDDVAEAFSRIASFPTDVPTPPDAVILHVDASSSYYQSTDSHQMYNEVVIATSMNLDDTLALYEASMTASGWTIDRTGRQTDSDGHHIGFVELNAADAERAVTPFRVVVREGDYDGTRVALLHRANVPFANQLDRYTGWYSTMPAPEGGTVVEARMRTSYRADGDRGIEWAADWYHEDVDEDGIRVAGVAAVDASGEYSVAGDSNLDNQSVFLDGSDAYRSVMLRFSTSEGNDIYPLRSWVGFTVWGSL